MKARTGYIALLLCLMVAELRSEESPILANRDLTLLEIRSIVVERRFDDEIIKNQRAIKQKLADEQWGNPTVRAHLAHLLLENVDLTTREALSLVTVVYKVESTYNDLCAAPLLLLFLRCLPEGVDAKVISDALNAAGWKKILSNDPLPIEFVQAHVDFTRRLRSNGQADGRGRIKFPFPITIISKR